MKIVLSSEAKASLRQIALYIAEHDPTRARGFVRELRSKAVEIARMPQAFPLVPRHETAGIRRRVYGRYLIFYRIEDAQVTVINILHGARGLRATAIPRRIASTSLTEHMRRRPRFAIRVR